jgi:hypothetical protein
MKDLPGTVSMPVRGPDVAFGGERTLLDRSGEPFSQESIRLWEQHTRDYVKAVQQGTV